MIELKQYIDNIVLNSNMFFSVAVPIMREINTNIRRLSAHTTIMTYEKLVNTRQRILGIRSIAFPSISTGVYSFPVELAAKIAVHTVNRFLQDNPDSFDLVEWVLFDTHTESVYEAAEKSYMEDESDDFDF